MDRNELYRDIIADVRTLLKARTHPRRRTIALSPEAAAWLQAIPGPSTVDTASAPAPAAPEPGPATLGKAPTAAPVDGPDDREAALAEAARRVSACTKCALCETRTQTVFSDGSPWARLAFVGEAPGADEDRQGTPFVGRAGQLLTDIITKGMRIHRSEVYICNVLKCRPPGNRDPQPEEIASCEPYLREQLRLVQPEVICALGSFAARFLTGLDLPLGRLRGSWREYEGIPVRVTYHPSYLLRNPSAKKQAWEDIQEIMRRLQLPIQG